MRHRPTTRFRWFALLPVALLALAAPVRADWVPVDLPFGDYLSEPITGVADAGPTDLWVVTTYRYNYQDEQHWRWNSNLYHSKNDGLLWDVPFDAPSSQSDPTPNKYPFQDTQLYAIAFADRDNGWAVGWKKPMFGINDPPGDYVFYHTTDRGQTWTISTLPNTGAVTPDEPDFAIDAQDAAHCIAVQGSHVFETTDGYRWIERTGVYPHFFSVQARGLVTPRAAGSEGAEGVGGPLSLFAFFQDVAAPGAFHATRFADADHGWVAGGDATAGRILGTTNGGGAWNAQLVAPGVLFRALSAPSASEVWAAGQTTGTVPFGVIYHSSNGGTSWTVDATTPGRLFSMAFRDSTHGWAAGDGNLWRYIASAPVEPGDLDHSGKADVMDVVAVMRGVAGLNAASRADIAAGDLASRDSLLTVADAVAALRVSAGAAPSGHEDDPARVVIVYNTVSQDSDGDGVGDSLQVARYYSQRRSVPVGNLIPITWHDADGFWDHELADGGGRANWTDAFHAIVEPLRAKIDAIGRGNVDTLLFCAGVPYYVQLRGMDGVSDSFALDTALNDLYRADAENWTSGSPYFAALGDAAHRYARPRFETGARPMGQMVAAAAGAVRDPYYLVSRLDGPSLNACLAMVDNAIFAEQYRGPGGYEGTAYVDTRAAVTHGAPFSLSELAAFVPSFYSYAEIDESIARTILTFSNRGLAWKDEITNAQIGGAPDGGGPKWRDGFPSAAAPRAMFYAGWYNYATYNNVWDWLPGSIGIDYDSASAFGFRGTTYFAGGALGNGLTALVGVLGEPYNYHPKPDALMEYLARGFSFAEAAMLCTETPRMAKALFLGDPLYRPFAPHAAVAVPVPTQTITSRSTTGGWTVNLTTNIPVKATLAYTTDGSDPTASSPSVPAQPGFYALRHTFGVSALGTIRYVVQAMDPTGRVTVSAVRSLP